MPEPSEPQVRFKGNMFARPDYFTTDVTRGATRTPTGTRVCALTSDFLLGFRDAVIYECGDAYRTVMKSCGRRWGKTFIQRLDKELTAHYQMPLKDMATAVVHTCLGDAFAAHGWGRLKIDLSSCEHGLILVELSDSVMPDLVKESDRPVDHLMVGLLGAIFSHFSGSELDAIQTDCPTRGANASRFLIAANSRIAELQEWLDNIDGEVPTHDAILARLVPQSAVVEEMTVGVS